MNQLLVIGLDGMTWDVADQISMPNLESLIQGGGRSPLRSTHPPVTCPAWPSYLTGKKPDQHGIHDFAQLSENGEINLSDFEDFDSPTLIDVMNDQNVPSIFFEIPLTFPAPEGQSEVISGYPAELNKQKFSNPSTRSLLENRFGSFPPISPSRYTGHNQGEIKSTFFEATRYRSRAFRMMLEKYDWQFSTINFHLPDQFAHYFWDQYSADPDSNPLTEAYQLLDETLGKIIETVPDDTNIMVISDHGQGPQQSTVNLNYALLKGGFLKLKSGPLTRLKKWLFKTGITPARIKRNLDTLNLTWIVKFLGREQRDELLNKFLSFRDIDFEQSEAFAFGHIGQIYWIGHNDNRLKELKSFLNDFSTDGESLNVDKFINLRENESPSFKQPKWLLKMNDWAEIAYPLFLGEWSLKQEATFAGCHRLHGILAWRGPDLVSDPPKNPSLLDLAPTIHRLLDLPPQINFDGRVLEEILADSAPPSQKPRNYHSDQGEHLNGPDEERVEQLKNLGYL